MYSLSSFVSIGARDGCAGAPCRTGRGAQVRGFVICGAVELAEAVESVVVVVPHVLSGLGDEFSVFGRVCVSGTCLGHILVQRLVACVLRGLSLPERFQGVFSVRDFQE